jgi:hypothetical protein
VCGKLQATLPVPVPLQPIVHTPGFTVQPLPLSLFASKPLAVPARNFRQRALSLPPVTAEMLLKPFANMPLSDQQQQPQQSQQLQDKLGSWQSGEFDPNTLAPKHSSDLSAYVQLVTSVQLLLLLICLLVCF